MSKTAELALGRILRMGARPSQPGDVAEYERCRAIILAEYDAGMLASTSTADTAPNYARDRLKGAQGD